MKQKLPILSRMLLTLAFMLIACGSLFAQAIEITGVVRDESNQPIPGAAVIIKGTQQGTQTQIDGSYYIKAAKNQTLVFSNLGYKTVEVIIASDPLVVVSGKNYRISVVLGNTAKTLSEVVVTTALGVKKEQKRLGYSVSELKGSDLTVARDPNPVNGLAGKISGLTIGASAELFGRPQVVLRGANEILYVIDGVPISSDTYNFSPDDVESYTVLKGPNAAALYGFRGINGAIIITTKRGTTEKKGWQVDFNSTNTLENGFIVNPKVQTEYGRGSKFQYAYTSNGTVTGADVLYDNKNRLQEYGPRFEGQALKQYDSPYNTVTGIRGTTPWLARGAKNFETFAGTGIITTDNIAAATRGTTYDTRLSYSHTYQKGIFPNTGLNIDNFQINSGISITPKLRLDGDLNFNYQYSPNVPDASYGPNSYSYMFKVYGSSDYDINDLKDVYKGPQGVNNLVQYAPEYGRLNSAWFIAKKWLRGKNKTDVYGYLKATYKFNNDVSLSFRTQLTAWDQTLTETVPASTNLNTYLSWYYFGWYGDYREDHRRLVENNNDLNLNYQHSWHNWNLNVLVGASDRSYAYHSTWTTTVDLSIPGVYNFNNSTNPVKSWLFDSKMQVYSGYASADFGYKNYFNVNATDRVDNLSTFSSGNQTYQYPSIALSSVISDYVKFPSFISFVKVRGSIATVKGGLTASSIGSAFQANTGSTLNGGLLGYGTEPITSYDGPSFINSTGAASGSIYNNTPSVNLSNTISNASIKPYQVTSDEVGLDLKFINNRLGFDGTYFRTVNGPNIFQLPVAPSTGYTNQIINGVTSLKKGVELTLTGAPLRSKKGLNWDVNIVYSTLRQTLKNIYQNLPTLQQNNHNYVIGERLDGIYGTKLVRDGSGNIINAGGTPLFPNGSTSTNPTYTSLLGYADPDFTFGINNKFSVQGWTFSFQFDGRIGGKIYDQTWYHADNGGTSYESASGDYGVARLKEWQSTANQTVSATPAYVGPGVQIATGVPTYANGQISNLSALTFTPNTTAVTVQSYLSSGISGNDEYYTISRSYAKLREVTLGYVVPSSLLKGTWVRKLSFTLVGRNLLYFAARKDIDIDQYASGYNSADRSIQGNSASIDLQTQTARRFGFNINIGF